jgi:hypothetical protein
MGNYRFMVVPQGKTIEEFMGCAETLHETMDGNEQLMMWGIPRNLVKLHGSRLEACRRLRELDDYAGEEGEIPFHLLGFSDNIQDDIECSKLPFIGGIDSAVPLRVPNFELIVNGQEIAEPRGDWWDRARFNPNMLDNLVYAREVFGQ